MRLAVEVALRSRPRKIHNIVFLGGDSKVGELRRYVLSELGKDIANDTARGFFLGSRRLDEETCFRVYGLNGDDCREVIARWSVPRARRRA